MNFKVYLDGSFSYIVGTDEEEPNGDTVFETLNEAKKRIIEEEINPTIETYQLAKRRIKSFGVKDIELE